MNDFPARSNQKKHTNEQIAFVSVRHLCESHSMSLMLSSPAAQKISKIFKISKISKIHSTVIPLSTLKKMMTI